jgi:tetratricopeptide (TPR) repeat protein
MIDRQTVDGLLEQAYNLIQQGDPEAAIAVGNQLLEQRHARGFEIIALAYEQQGRSQEAIAVLKEGVSKVPNAWPLWELLGNLFSDADEYQEASTAYRKAMECPNVDRDSVNYNHAILLKRMGNLDEAGALCDQVRGGDLRNKVRVLKLSVLNAQKRYNEVIQGGQSLVEELLSVPELPEEDMQDVARTYAEIGRAHWEGSYNRDGAWENAWKALEWDRSENSALWLVREIINRKSPSSKWYKLVVEGRWHFAIDPEKPPPGFITTYEVVADSPEDAMAFAQDLEPLEVRASMRLDSNEDLGAYPDNQQGVYWRSAYGFYMN